MTTFAEGRAIATKIATITKQSVFNFQGKDQNKIWLKNLVNQMGVTIKDVNRILDALIDDPFVGYEPIGQVAYNNPVVASILAQYQR